MNWLSENWHYLLISVVIGIAIGLGQVLFRYRPESGFSWRVIRHAIFSLQGACYLAINGAVAGLGYFLLVYRDGNIFVELGSNKLLSSIVAGLGALILTKIGLDIVVSGIVSALQIQIRDQLDHHVDKMEAIARAQLIQESVSRVMPLLNDRVTVHSVMDFFRTNLVVYQNLSLDEKAKLGQYLVDIEDRKDLGDSVRIMTTAFAMLGVTGEANYVSLVEGLLAHLASLDRKETDAVTEAASREQGASN